MRKPIEPIIEKELLNGNGVNELSSFIKVKENGKEKKTIESKKKSARTLLLKSCGSWMSKN